jgi:hypothetical protein
MSDLVESTGPKAHARIVYLGSVSPHWEVYGDWGDRQVLDEFRARVLARLVLLPREDPQFRRNRERVVRDAEREMISIEWDLGVVSQPVTARPPVSAPDADAVTESPAADDAVTSEDAVTSDDPPVADVSVAPDGAAASDDT